MTNKPTTDLPTAAKGATNCEKEMAKRKLDPKALTLFTIGMTDASKSITAGDLTAMSEEINCQLEEIKNGNVGLIETFLFSQGVALHHMFQHFFRNYLTSITVEEKQVYGKLAFKAQNQSRKTLLTLAEVKNPKKATFIKQQNNAINQQINNSKKFPKNIREPSTELLSEQQYETLDTGRTFETIAANTQVETVGNVNGSNNS